MTLTYEIDHQENMTLISAHGEVTNVNDIISYVASFVKELKETSPHCVLIDHRELTGELDVIDNVKVVTDFAEAIKDLKQMRLAVVTTPQRLSSVTFLETIAQNIGIMGLAFDDMDEALEWLRE